MVEVSQACPPSFSTRLRHKVGLLRSNPQTPSGTSCGRASMWKNRTLSTSRWWRSPHQLKELCQSVVCFSMKCGWMPQIGLELVPVNNEQFQRQFHGDYDVCMEITMFEISIHIDTSAQPMLTLKFQYTAKADIEFSIHSDTSTQPRLTLKFQYTVIRAHTQCWHWNFNTQRYEHTANTDIEISIHSDTNPQSRLTLKPHEATINWNFNTHSYNADIEISNPNPPVDRATNGWHKKAQFDQSSKVTNGWHKKTQFDQR